MSDHPKYGDMMRMPCLGGERLMMYVGPDSEPPVSDKWATYAVIAPSSPTDYPEGYVSSWGAPHLLINKRNRWLDE